MYLVDTNVFGEILLGQTHADEAKAFITAGAGKSLHLSDFSLHSIGVVLRRNKKLHALTDFVNDVVLSGAVQVLSLSPRELLDVVSLAGNLGLDFDDAYQYTLAAKHDLAIVSFDSD